MSKIQFCHECGQQKPRQGGGLKTILGSRCFVCSDCRPKLKTGRPKVDPETKKHAVAICLTNAQRKKLDMLGGSKFVQGVLDRWFMGERVILGKYVEPNTVEKL